MLSVYRVEVTKGQPAFSAMANGQIKGVGDVGNDRANCYQTVIKGWKSVLRWMVCLRRDLLLWVGRPG